MNDKKHSAGNHQGNNDKENTSISLRKLMAKKQVGNTQKSIDNKKNKNGFFDKLGLPQILFLFFSITPLFFSVTIFLSKTFFDRKPQEVNTNQLNQQLSPDEKLKKSINQLQENQSNLQNSSNFPIKNNDQQHLSNKNGLEKHKTQSSNYLSAFTHDQNTESIVNKIIKICKRSQLPIDNISITLIDLNKNSKASFQGEKLRYPASVVKLFWLVMAMYKLSQETTNIAIKSDIEKMIKESDNDSSGRVLDWLTDTHSGEKLSKKDFEKWRNKRQSLNIFFLNYGYGELDISQKTFPMPKQKYNEPQGRDFQLRGENLNNPVRNKLSTDQAAFLMYTIIHRPEFSYAKFLLTTNLKTFNWKDKNINYFNPIRSFFGESLPTNVDFVSKAGWTNSTRQEVAYIATKDGKARYILAFFAEDPAYSQDKNIFPEVSKMVFQEMSGLK